jgi:hypothetical protein
MNSVMSDWKPNVLRGYLEIGAYSYMLRFQCIGNTIPILSIIMDKISCCKKRDDCLLENTLPKVIVTCGYK